MTSEERAELERAVERMNAAKDLKENRAWSVIQSYLKWYAEQENAAWRQCKTWDETNVLKGLTQNADDMVELLDTLIEIGKMAEAKLKEREDAVQE